MQPRVDLALLVAALDEEDEAPTRAFVDKQTGAIEVVPRAEPDDDSDVATMFADVLGTPERWVEVTPLPSWRRHQVRIRFADEVDDVHTRLRLLEALEDPRPFARFASVLRRHAAAEAQWNEHRQRAFGADARKWLAMQEL